MKTSSAVPLHVLLWLIPCSLLFLFAYSSSIQAVVDAWNGVDSHSNNHGWLVLGCTLYLLWLKKDQLLSLPLAPSPLAFVGLAGAAALWFLGRVTQIQAAQMAMLPVLVLLAVGAFFSLRHMYAVLLPIGLLFFALPIWQPLLPWLQDVTTVVTHFNLKLAGRPVYVVDNFVHVSGGSFVIEEACSGLRFLLVSTTLSLMNSALNRHTWKQGAFMLSLAILLSFIANWVRVLVVVLLGDFTQMQHPWVNDHANMGWVLYLVMVLIPFFLISRYVPLPAASPVAESQPKSVASQDLSPRTRTLQILAAMTLFLTPFGFQWLGAMSTENATPPVLPPRIGEWSAVPDVGNGWQPAFLNAALTSTQAYQRGGDVVRVNLAWYQTQEQGAELINVNNAIADGETWQVEPASESVVAGDTLSVQAATVTGVKKERVWYWYDVGGYLTSNDYAAKISQVRAFMHGRGDATLVAISTPCSGSCQPQDALLDEFLAAMPSGFHALVSDMRP